MWHAHACGQYLHASEGLGLVQERDEEIHLLRQGDAVYTEPGVWHWHGAAPDRFATLLAIWEAPSDAETEESTWGDHVTDEEYQDQSARI